MARSSVARSVVGPLSRAISAVEALALIRRGARVQIVMPDRDALAEIGGNLMNASRRGAVAAAGVAQGARARARDLARGDPAGR